MKAIATAVLMSACVIALAACGSDDKDDGTSGSGATGGTGGAAGESGSGGSSGTGGSGGSGGTGGTGGSSGSGGSASGGTGGTMAQPVMCGGETCPAPMNSRLRACCTEDTDECGEEIPGGFIGECAVPATPHPDCDGVMLMGFPVTGCCTPEGRCGVGAGIIFGEPCTSIEELQALAGDGGTPDGGTADGGIGSDLMPKACTPL